MRKSIISLIIVWTLIILGVSLRAFKADVYPVDNNDDGLHYTWAGMSFWKNPLKPTTHSIFDQDNLSLKWRSQFMDYIPILRFGLKVVEPWQDHPPLGAALIGLPAKLLGYQPYALVPQMIVRWPAIIASTLTLYFTYLIAKEWFSEKVAKLSLVGLATIPYFVIAHRQAFLENFLTPLFLITVYDLMKYLKTKDKKDLVKVMGLSFLAGWIKIVGFSIPFMIAGWLLIEKKVSEGKKLIMTGVVSVMAYLGYAFLVSKEVFLQTLANQGTRGAFVSSFLDGLTYPEFYGAFRDGWYVLGLIMALMLLVMKKNKAFSWFMACWLVVIFLTSGKLANSPWYRYPLIPFMAMGLGYYAAKFLKNNSLYLGLPFWLLGLTGFDLLKIELPTMVLRIATLGFAGIYGLKLMVKHKLIKKLAYLTTRIFLISLVLLNIIVILKFSTIYCSHEQCLAPFKIILEEK